MILFTLCLLILKYMSQGAGEPLEAPGLISLIVSILGQMSTMWDEPTAKRKIHAEVSH